MYSFDFNDLPCNECLVKSTCRNKEYISCPMLFKHFQEFRNTYPSMVDFSRNIENAIANCFNLKICNIYLTQNNNGLLTVWTNFSGDT